MSLSTKPWKTATDTPSSTKPTILALSARLQVITNNYSKLKEFKEKEILPFVAEERGGREEDSTLIWSYYEDKCEYADAEFSLIADEVVLLGCKLSVTADVLKKLEVELGEASAEIKELKELFAKAKEMETDLWREIGSK